MASTIVYLDVDDEITSAAARVRSASGGRVAVVLPYGSRVATSRINFRLLARDAQTNGKRLSVVAGDAATRSLAASAGLPVFGSVAEYESSLEGGSDDAATPPTDGALHSVTVATPAPAATIRARPTPRAPAAIPAARVVADTPDRPASDAATPIGRERQTGRVGRRGIGRTPLVISAAILALAVVVGGVGAFLLLPTATVIITPRSETIGPIALRIVADPSATEPDIENAVVPAERLTIDLAAADSFPATGQRIEEAKATGTVRFSNLDPTGSNTIKAGSIVSTGSGVRFRTDASITLPAAQLVLGNPITVIESRKSVGVTAVDAGPDGNVEPNTITTVPRGEEPLFLKVNNPEATTGGTREEFARVVQADVDAAVADLTARLVAAFADRLDDPELLPGDTATVFPETQTLGEPVFGVDPASLVGQETATFDLGATSQGTVVAVDTAPVRLVAEARITSSVDPGFTLVEGSGEVQDAPAEIAGGVITFPVSITARQRLVLDPGTIEARILGQPLAEARAILATYGEADLSVWPDWVGTIPTLDSRVEVTTAGASP